MTRIRQRWLRRLLRNKSAWLGSVLSALVVCVALAAPLIAPYDPTEVFAGDPLLPPTRGYWLGTDNLGRDTLSRIIFGAQASLAVAIGTVAIAQSIGIFLGLLSGYFGGRLDRFTMFAMDSVLAFPTLILAMAISAMIGSGLKNIVIAVGIVSVPVFARLTRSQVIAVKAEDFVQGAQAIGASNDRIIFRHVLPNVLSPLIVQSSFTAAQSILFEAALSFLGVGVQPPTPAWGAMLRDGYGFLNQSPWTSVAPGLAIMGAILAFNLLGDALRDSLDVTLAERGG
jgi:ABC-type dipeptide/oligopeptide/nickel transport system permease subunit